MSPRYVWFVFLGQTTLKIHRNFNFDPKNMICLVGMVYKNVHIYENKFTIQIVVSKVP